MVFRVVKKLYAEFIDEVLKFLLQIPHHDGDVHDPGLVELADLTLDHAFTEHLQESFRRFKGQWYKTGAKACRQDDGAVDPVLLEQFHTLL